jgi:O-antigen/teichoic acid export membrane protein
MTAAGEHDLPVDPATRDASTRDRLSWLLIVGGGAFAQVLVTVTGVISARMLGVEGRGDVALVASLSAMASQLTLGGSLPNAITKMLADRQVAARDGLRRIVRRLLLLALVPAAAVVGYLVFLRHEDLGSLTWALAITLAVMTVQTMMYRVLIGSLLGEGAPLLRVALTGLLPQVVITLVLGTAFVAGADWNAAEYLIAYVASNGAAFFFCLRFLAPPTHRAEDALDGRELVRLARRTHIGSVGPIDGLALDRNLVGSLLGSAPLGLYSVATALAGLTSILGGAMAVVVLPRVAVAQQNPEGERRLVRTWLVVAAGVIGTVVLALELIAGPLIRFAFGEDFVAGTATARWLLAASGMLGFRRVLIAILQGRGKGGGASVIELALMPFMILGIYLAARQDSLVGVGISMAAVALASCVALGFQVLRTGRSPRGRDHAATDDHQDVSPSPTTTT